MPTQMHLPVQPAGAQEINAVLAMVQRDEKVAYFASGGPLFVPRADDAGGRGGGGHVAEAAPRFGAAEAVRYGGALLALPALVALGVLDAGAQTYGALKRGFYGL